MGITRISSNSMVDNGIYNIQNNLSTMANLQNEIASGKKISVPSDDPVGLSQLLQLNLEKNNDTQYNNNINEALSEMQTTESSVGNIVDLAQQANQLAVQAANGTNSASQLSAISQQVNGILNQVVSLGNTAFEGKYIFGGFKTDNPPFTVAGSNITYNGSPSGTAPRQVEIASNTSVPVNINGSDLLGSVTVTAGVPTAGSGLLYDLTKFKIDLQNQNFTSIRADIGSIQTDQQNILTQQTQLGGRINQLQLTQNRIQDGQVIQDQQISNLQDVNMPQAISDLNFSQTVYQASLSVMSKIMQNSLVNFL